jgi:hypothetical protein
VHIIPDLVGVELALALLHDLVRPRSRQVLEVLLMVLVLGENPSSPRRSPKQPKW